MMRLYPAGWTKTLHELLAERGQHNAQEIEWARAYEREKLRSWARFPRNGDIFEAMRDVEVTCMTHWSAPFTGGSKAMLPRRTKIIVLVGPDPEPVGINATPVEYEQLEARLVSEADRSSPKYGGYSVSLSTETLNKEFRFVGVGVPRATT